MVLFVERSGELFYMARLRTEGTKPKRRSRSESESDKGEQYVCVDPKPDDLSMSRLKEG